jgi:hypothetical protein
MFAVRQADTYDGSTLVKSYKYLSFPRQFFGDDTDKVDGLVEKIIKSLQDRQALVKKLRGAPLILIKEDLKPNTYKLIEDHGITNMFELRMILGKRYNGKVSSRIVGIGQKNGTEIINAMEKHGLWVHLTTEKWEESEDQAI